MDKHTYNSVAHARLRYASPIHDEMIDEMADLMRLTPGMRVIDVGCAKAEILIRMADLCQVHAVGVDPSPPYIQDAQEGIAQRVPAADITLHQLEAADFNAEDASFDAVMCVNSSELYGSYDAALEAISALGKAGSMVLMGDFYWRAQPQAEMTRGFDVTKTYQSAISAGAERGLTPLYASVCTQVDIDHYIWTQNYSVEMYASDHPEDENAQALLERSRLLRNLYTEYGYETLGFGLFLFRKP